MPVRVFLCLFWRETHTKFLRVRFLMRPEEDKERQGTRAENRRRQSTEESSQQKSGRATVNERWHEMMGLRSWRLCRNFTIAIAHRGTESYIKVSQTFPFLRLQLTQVRDCLFFFSSTLTVVYVVSCVFVKKWEISLSGDERHHEMNGWPWVGLGCWDSGSRPAGVLLQW